MLLSDKAGIKVNAERPARKPEAEEIRKNIMKKVVPAEPAKA
jgi:hypothetical protein